MNIIEALFRNALQLLPNDDDRDALMATIDECYDKLLDQTEQLPDAKIVGRHLFDMVLAQQELLEKAELGRFILGFQVGMRFAVDALLHPSFSISEPEV